jgi:hypothetical protein
MRRKNDAYYTPDFLIKSFFNKEYILLNGVVLEPCAGEGAISDFLKQNYAATRVETNDLDTTLDVDSYYDCRDLLKLPKHYNWIITTNFA